MELKEFITASLVEIQQGVQDAINVCHQEKISGVINPAVSDTGSITSIHISSHIQKVEFDIAVTTENSNTSQESGNMKGGIKVLSGSVDKSATEKDSDSKSSRIKFIIPIIPPVTAVDQVKIEIPKFDGLY